MKRKDYLNDTGRIKNGNIRYTNSTKFLLPMLNFKSSDFDDNLINVYINPGRKPELVLVFEKDEEKVYSSLVKCRIVEHHLEDYVDEDEVVVKFAIPNEDIYNKFLDGRYSKFDDDYKQKLIKIYGIKVFKDDTLNVSMCDTLYPREDKIRAIADRVGVHVSMIKDVYDKPDLTYEVFIPRNKLTLKAEAVDE